MHYWFSRELCWKEKIGGEWVESTPPRPEWALQQEDIPAIRFIPVWTTSSSLNDVKKHFFWKTVEALEHQYEEINIWLEKNDYEPLPKRHIQSTDFLNPQELQALEEQGLLIKKTPDPASTYTPDPDPPLPRQHIQISEGGFRFQARH